MSQEDHPQKIYFDESGFTGNNLIHPSQEFFSYASVATDDDEAKDFVEYIIRKYNIQNGELKGKNLVKFNRGRKAIDEVFLTFEGRIKVSISNKKYALACKFYEYIFEPCISENNILFYNINFHRFVSVLLYVEFASKSKGAEEIFIEFEQLMRDKDLTKLPSIFNSSIHPDNSSSIIQIREFAQCQVKNIIDELESLPGDGIGKWLLDLTDTALFTLLANWGKEHNQITAICDFSKPINHNQDLYNIMINREDRIFSSMSGEKHPITFNLAEPIQLVKVGMQFAQPRTTGCGCPPIKILRGAGAQSTACSINR